ncbi:MAG: acyl carrier protein [Candidatus Omnitrophica bacterium]|nr:acyl carrier protein [Candidatus Omnitrophota bacterium]
MEQRVKGVMAEVFSVDTNEITDDTSAHTIVMWDSLKHIDLILALEKEFNIRFENEDIATMIDYPLILNTVKSYVE